MEQLFIIAIVLYWSFVFVTSVIGNCCLLVAVFTKNNMRTPVNMYITNIAISDLFFTLSSIAEVMEFLHQGWTFGDLFCRIHGSFIEVFYTVSILTLTIMALDRYKSIQKTKRYEKSIRSYVKMSLVIWLFSALICSPLAYGRAVLYRHGNFYCEVCRWPHYATLVYYSIFTIITYLFPLLVLLFTQTKLSSILKHNYIPRIRARISLQHLRRKSAAPGETLPGVNSPFRRKHAITDPTCTSQFIKPAPQRKNAVTNMNSDKKIAETRGRRKAAITNDTCINQQAEILDAIREKRNRVAIRRLVITTITFVVLWTPMVLIRFLYYSYHTIHPTVYLCCQGIAFATTVANFFIYPKFRRSLNLFAVFKNLFHIRRQRKFSQHCDIAMNPYIVATPD